MTSPALPLTLPIPPRLSPLQGDGAKKRLNLTIDAALSDTAKQLGINLSREAECGILLAVRRIQDAAWLTENAAAIAAYNTRLEAEGLFSDEFRTF